MTEPDPDLERDLRQALRPADPDPRRLQAGRAQLLQATRTQRQQRRWPWALGATLAAGALVAVFAIGLQALQQSPLGGGATADPACNNPTTGYPLNSTSNVPPCANPTAAGTEAFTGSVPITAVATLRPTVGILTTTTAFPQVLVRVSSQPNSGLDRTHWVEGTRIVSLPLLDNAFPYWHDMLKPRFSPDGRQLAWAEAGASGGHTLWVATIDQSLSLAPTRVATTPPPADGDKAPPFYLSGFAWGPNGELFYSTAATALGGLDNAGVLYRWLGEGAAIQVTTGAFHAVLALSADGAQAYVTRLLPENAEWQTAGWGVLHVLTGQVEVLTFRPTGDRAYYYSFEVATLGDGSQRLITLYSASAARGTTVLTGEPELLSMDPQTRQVEVLWSTTSGSMVMGAGDVFFDPQDPGRFVLSVDGRPYLGRVDGSAPVPLSDAWATPLAWTAEGIVLLVTDKAYRQALWLLDAQGALRAQFDFPAADAPNAVNTPVTAPQTYGPERTSTYPIERRWMNSAGLRQFVRETQVGTPGGWAVVSVTQEGDPVTTTVALSETGAPLAVFVDRSADAFSGFRDIEFYECLSIEQQARDLVLLDCTGDGLTLPTSMVWASSLPLDPNYDLDEIEVQLRTWLDRTALELTMQGEELFLNGPQPVDMVWTLTDDEGRIYKIEQQTGTLVEIDARGQFDLAPSGPALDVSELRAMAIQFLARATPAVDVNDGRWSENSNNKGNNYFFDWSDSNGRRVQVAYTASGFLFGYLNTFALPGRGAFVEAQVGPEGTGVRTGPGYDFELIGEIAMFSTIIVEGQFEATDGELWYQVRLNTGQLGWAQSGEIVLPEGAGVPAVTPGP